MSIERPFASPPGVTLVLREPPRAAIAVASEQERRAQLERLVREHHTFVWRTAQRLGVPPADVADAVQEVFLLAGRKLDEIRDERGFLFQTCMYVAGHVRRRAQRCREVVDDDRVHAEVDDRATPEQSVVAAEARATLQTILDEMTDELRVVFVLFELERVTMIEISKMLGIPAGTVASRLRRAREFFLSRVEHDGRGEP
jgi:RNA polymerase sigma-70 factor (ECF subfamily)